VSLTVSLIAFASFIAATGAVLAVALLIRDLRRSNKKPDERLELTPEQVRAEAAILPPPPPSGRIDRAFYGLIESSGTGIDPQAALALVIGGAIVGCATALVLSEHLLAGGAGLLLGCSLPLAWWALGRMRRLRLMKRNLPETLEMLADGVRTGGSLQQAAELVAEQAPAPLSREFDYCVSQLKLGHSPLAVMQRMARRIPLPEFRIFATAVLVHRQTGGNLALLAERLATSARDRYEFHGHVRAVTAASRFSVIGLTLGTVVAMGILAWLRPEYLEVFRSHELGPSLLAVSAGLQVLGIVWIWRTLKVHF